MSKILYFDIETTGVKHWRNGIHQIAGRIEIDGQFKKVFDYKVRPNPACTIEDEALAAGNVTREMIAAYPEMGDVYQNLIALLSRYVNKWNKTDKFFLVGYNNASFDNQFFRAFFVQNGDEYFGSWFWTPAIDVMVLAGEYLKDERARLNNFQLATVAAYLGIQVDPALLHDASHDLEITQQIYKIVTNRKPIPIT